MEAVCRKKDLWREAGEIQRLSTPLKETIENEVDRDLEYQRRFWARRPDGKVVDKKKEICYVLGSRGK